MQKTKKALDLKQIKDSYHYFKNNSSGGTADDKLLFKVASQVTFIEWEKIILDNEIPAIKMSKEEMSLVKGGLISKIVSELKDLEAFGKVMSKVKGVVGEVKGKIC